MQRSSGENSQLRNMQGCFSVYEIQFYFTVALVVIYSVNYLIHLGILDLQLTSNWP